MTRKTLAIIVTFALELFILSPSGAAGADATSLNPHLRDGCIKCHDESTVPAGERTRIFVPGEEGPHAVLAHSCRSCHKEGKENFWIIVLPDGHRTPSRTVTPAEDAWPSSKSADEVQEEGFENTHDSMDCAGCHGKKAGDLKAGSATPPGFSADSVDAFCRRCHEDIDRTHFPRGNRPKPGITCLNCHAVHGRTLIYPALRDDYPIFLIDATALNPHGGKIFCLSCHQDSPTGGQVVNFRSGEDQSGMCQRCHKAVDHHPLAVKSNPGTWKMDFSDLPLEDEKLTCVTCHDPPECSNDLDTGNARFLRGGPYNAVEEFCMRCHEGRNIANLNPHDQIDEDGKVKRKQCLYCHSRLPEATDDILAPEDFTDSLQSLCASCHPAPPHPDVDHMVRVPVKMLENIRRYEERRLVRLPLEDGDKLTCVTCHNPHERGLLRGPPGVGADEEKRLRLTTFNEICTPCHGRH